MEKFNYTNKNNFLQWLKLVWLGLIILFFTSIVITMEDNGRFIYLYTGIIGAAIVSLILINKMFLSQIYITENYIEYKSPFTKVKIEKDRIKGIDLLKKPRKRAPKYLTLNEKPDIHIGNYFLIIRKTSYKPDSPYFLAFSPVEDTYITAEYRVALYDKLKEYKYI